VLIVDPAKLKKPTAGQKKPGADKTPKKAKPARAAPDAAEETAG